jgi:hypothetical protein
MQLKINGLEVENNSLVKKMDELKLKQQVNLWNFKDYNLIV